MEKETLENVEIKISKLLKNQSLPAIDFHEFKQNYGLPNEGVNPHRIKSKDVVEAEVRKVFGLTRGKSGYSFVDCHGQKVLDRIKEIYPIIYNKEDVPKSKLIAKEFVKGIVTKIVKGKKVSWARFIHETNANQWSKWSSWMEKCVEKNVALLGKTMSKVKIEDSIKRLVKRKRANGRFLKHPLL